MFRNYKDIEQKIKETYKMSRKYQNIEFYDLMLSQYNTREKKKMNIWDAFDLLNNFIDNSDPDMELPNIYHLFQSAEAARKDNAEDWFQLTCLLHDLGKIMYIFGNDDTGTSVKQQWAIVGDTFILGCQIPDTIVFPEYNILNKDHQKYDNYGIYSRHCGLEKCKISWGHDEFLYRTLKNNENTLPPQAYYIIRYHSLYLWHSKNEYSHFENIYDTIMKPTVQRFNNYDLYSKENTKNKNIHELKEYYQKIFSKYFKNNDLYF
jgi:inositol oxygenase